MNGSAPSYTTAQPGSAISQQELDELKRDLPQQAQKIQDLYDATTDQALPQEGRDGAQQSLDAIRQQATANHRANIDRAALEAHLRRVLGADLARRIRFDGIMADGSVLTQEGAADADGSIVLNLDVIQAYIVDGKTIQSREQRAALVAWHELYHRGEAVYGATPPGAQAYRDMIARMYQNPALRSLAEAIQAERAAAVAQGADPRILIDHETAMREALAEVAGALESGAGVDYLTQRYADFAIPRQHIPALGRLLQKGARLLRKIAGKLRGRAYTEQQLSDAEAYRLFASVNQLRGADMPGQNPQPVGAGSVTAQNAGQNAGTPPSPGGGGAGGGVSSQAANANTANPPANNPPGANPQGAAPNPLNPQAQRQAPASGVVYSASPQTIANYEQRIDDLYDGKAEPKRRGGVRVLDNSDMLGMLGLGKLPVILAEGKVNAEKHPNTTREVWKKVPGWLDNPALVFDSATEAGRLVFIAPEKVAGEPVRMVLEPAHGGMTVNVLVNTYDQDANNDAIDRWLKPEQKTRTKTSGAQKTQWRTPLRYYDTQKARLVLTVGQQQSLRTVIESGAGAEPHVYDTRFQPRASSRGMPILNELNLKSYRDSGQTVTPKTATDHSALLNPEAVENETTENTGETTPQESTPPEADRTTYSTAPQFEETARQNGGEAAYEQAQAAGKTNLTYRQWVQVRTPAFKQWFGNSRVIDPATGEPLVLYHETNADFDTFDLSRGTHQQNDFATPTGIFTKSNDARIGLGDRQIPLFVKLENPLTLPDRAAIVRHFRDNIPGFAALHDAYNNVDATYSARQLEAEERDDALLDRLLDGVEDTDARSRILDDFDTQSEAQQVNREWLAESDRLAQEMKGLVNDYFRSGAYDGMHIQRDAGSLGRTTDAWVALRPNQVKHATDNSGAFDAGNDNIRYSVPPALQTQLDKHTPARYGALANAFAVYENAGYEAARDSLIQWAEEHYAGQGLGAMRLVLDGYHHERQAGTAINIPPPAALSDSEAQALADFMAGIPARAQEAAAQKREMDARAAAGLPLLFSTTPGGTYYRRNNRSEPYNDDFVMMFADKTDRLEHYGKNLWQIPPDAGARVYAGSEEFRSAMREWLEKNETWFKEMGYAKRPGWIETLLDEANPDDIVDSAGFWDIADRSVMRYFDEEVMQPNGWDVVETYDGAITFNPDIVERVEEEDDSDEWLEARYEAYKAAHPEQEEAEEEAEPKPLEEIPGRALKGDTVTHQVYDLDLDKTWSFTNGEDAAAFKQRKGEEAGDAGRFMLQEVEPHVKEYDPLYSAPPVPSQLASERLATIRESGGRRAYDEAAKRGRTVLSYHDWLTVRSPSFKAWFGDWQAGESSRAVHPRTGEPLKVWLRRAAPGYMTFTDKASPRAAFAGFIRVDNDASGGVWAVFDRNQLMPAPDPVPATPPAAQLAYSTAPQERVSRFAQAVDAIANGESIRGQYITLGETTPEALQIAGLPNNRITISKRVISKAMRRGLGEIDYGHYLTPETLKALPRQLNRPVGVWKSSEESTNADGFVVLTELKENHPDDGVLPVIASLFLKKIHDGLEVTGISSAYGKRKGNIRNLIRDVAPLYWDKEKGPHLVNWLGLQLPPRFSSDANLRRANIKTNEDLSQDGLRDDAPLYSTAPAALATAYSVPPWELRAEPPTRAALRQRILDWFADPDRQDKWFDNQGELERIMKAHPGNTLAEAVRNSYKTYNAKVQRDIERELKPQFDAIAARLGAEYKRLRQSVPMYRGLSTADGMNLFMEHLDKIGKYIYHGRERNLEIAIRTGGQDMAGSGRTDAEIAEVEAFFNQPEHGGGVLIRLYDDLYQNQLKPVMDAADAKLRAAGLLTPEMEAARPQYRYYIPLYGKPELEDPALSANINDSFSARTGGNTMTRDTLQNRTHNAGGRHGTEAHNLFETLFTQAEIAIRRAQMQEPKRRLWDFLQTAEGIAAFDATTQSHTIGAGNTNPVNAAGQLTWQTAATAPNQIVWQDGNHIHIMTIGNGRALNAVRNFNQPAFPYDGDPSKQPGAAAYHAVGWATRFMGSMYTRFNPSFILRNKVMDSLQQWQLLLADAPVGKMTTAKGVQGYLEAAGNVAGRMGLVMNAMKYNILWTGSIGKNSEYQQWLERYAAQGGVTSYATFLGRDSLMNLSRAAWKEAATAGERARHPGDALTWGGKLMDGLNNLAEMTTRVSAYRALVEAGVSEERAANYVKDIMNFETKGENARHANALYPFFTTSLYDARRLFKVLSKKEGQVVFTALVGFSYVLWATIAAATGDDEDGVAWVDKYPMGVAARYAIIPIRSDDGKMRGEGIRIPLGFGLGRLANTVALSLRRFKNGTDNTGELISNLVNHAAIGSFSPLQPSDVNISKDPTYWLAQTFVPQVAKPLLQYASNKNWRGMPIYNSDQYRSDGDLDYNTGMETTPDVFKTIAEKWYDATGYDVAPESLAHWYNAALGGLGADMTGVAETILDQTGHGNKSAASWYKAAPVIGGFVQGAPTEDRERYYAYRDAVKDGSARYINAAMRGKNGDRYQDDVYWQARFDAVEKQLQRLRKQRKQLRQMLTGDERQAMEREYNDAMLNLQRGMVQEFETQTGRRK